MPGPTPKPAALRQRTNKHSTNAQLQTLEKPIERAPRLPALKSGEKYHPMTVDWWKDVWRSPMAVEFVKADIHGLYRLAALVDAFWQGVDHFPKDIVALEAQIGRSGQCYGLTPLDRRRLQWEVMRVEAAEKKPRRAAPADEREVLRALA